MTSRCHCSCLPAQAWFSCSACSARALARYTAAFRRSISAWARRSCTVAVACVCEVAMAQVITIR